MTQWEEIKKEYRETPIPANGPQQVLEAMARAKQNRNRYKTLARYGTVAAAVLLVVLIFPRIFLFLGGAAKESDDGFYMQDADVKAPASFSGMATQDNGGKNDATAEAPQQQYPESALGSSDALADERAPEADRDYGETVEEGVVLWTESRDAISKEIISQMELRMQEQNEIYYIKSEQYPDGFDGLNEAQTYYINEEGLLVIVFSAGEVAPKEQGEAEFVIPAEVFQP